jgi:hypothetical protein
MYHVQTCIYRVQPKSTRSQSQMKMLRRTPDDPNASDWSNQRTFRTTYNASKIKNLKRFNFG